MTESLNGLRFDIYERVQLPDNVAAIEELEEIELVPHMQAIPLEDQVILRGHLLLTGAYRAGGEDRSALQPLEHWIPVEISLPPSRVEKLEELAVEIDNFDVDLLSSRALNVTGVLGLRGLQVSAPQAPVWREDGFTVVHQASGERENEPAAYEDDRYGLPPEQPADPFAQARAEEQGQGFDHAADVAANGFDNAAGYGFERADAYGFEPPPSREAPGAEAAPSYGASPDDPSQSEPDAASYRPPSPEPANYSSEPYGVPQDYGAASEAWGDVTKERQQQDAAPAERLPNDAAPAERLPDVAAPPEEKPELKVALNAKSYASASSASSGAGLLSRWSESEAVRAETRLPETAEPAAEPVSASAAEASAESSGDEIEWTRLFLSKGADAQPFRKVKLCIVQREDTLEAIATRYNVQPRELQLHNRLGEPTLTEGQILYIP